MRINPIELLANEKLWTEAAKKAYEGYAESTCGKTYDGREMPEWQELNPAIQKAWTAAMHAGFGLIVRAVAVHSDFA